MSNFFYLQLAASFVIGGLWVATATYIAERAGSKVGGLLGGLPSGLVVVLLFIGVAQGPDAAAATTTVIPLASAINTLFMITFARAARKGLFTSLGAAMAVWLMLQGAVVLSRVHSYIISVALCIASVAATYFAYERLVGVRSQKAEQTRHTRQQLVCRMLFSGAMIAFALFMSRAAGPIIGGIFAMFPAVYISTMVITYRAAGPELAVATSESLVLAGATNGLIYATAVRYLYPAMGLMGGTLLAYLVVIITASVLYQFIKRRVS